MDFLYLAYLAVGILAGTLSGLLGIGGGIVVTPALMVLFKWQALFSDDFTAHIAIGTSFLVMVFTASSASYSFFRKNLIDFKIVFQLAWGLFFGIIFGGILASDLSGQFLIDLFAFFLMAIAIHLCFLPQKKLSAVESTLKNIKEPFINPFINPAFGFLSGFLSGLLGVGGGTILVPFLLARGKAIRGAMGISSCCSLMVAVMGSMTLALTGINHTARHAAPIFGLLGFVYWPAALGISITSMLFAPLGTQLALMISDKILTRIFAVLIVCSALYLLISA